MRKALGDHLILLLTIVASLAGLTGFYYTYYQDLDNQGIAGVVSLGIIALFFMTYNVYLIWTYSRQSKYPHIFEDINSGFAQVHILSRDLNEKDYKTIHGNLTDMCTSISSAFKYLEGSECGTCIKIMSDGEGGRPKLVTFCRDRKSSNKRPVGQKDSIDHWLTENADFQFIHKRLEKNSNKTSSFFNNNLPWKLDYFNTRLPDNWPPKSLFLIHWILRQIQWPLDYKSTIVVPIVPFSVNEQSQEALRGFLCIDSPKTFAFNKQFDVEILKGIADGLYNKIDTLHSIIRNG